MPSEALGQNGVNTQVVGAWIAAREDLSSCTTTNLGLPSPCAMFKVASRLERFETLANRGLILRLPILQALGPLVL